MMDPIAAPGMPMSRATTVTAVRIICTARLRTVDLLPAAFPSSRPPVPHGARPPFPRHHHGDRAVQGVGGCQSLPVSNLKPMPRTVVM